MKQRKTALVIAAALVVALFAGFFLGRWSRPAAAVHSSTESDVEVPQVYTCSMHPQIRLDGPGSCPICEMPLIPANAAQANDGSTPRLTLSERALAMANVETTAVGYRKMERDLRAVGKVQYDESSLATITARVDGYAEKLFVNITGVDINAGDHLVEIYSPELLVAQQELLIALQAGNQGPSVETVKGKILRLGLNQAQVNALVETRKIADRATLYSPISGTVIEKSIIENAAFRAGDALFRIANLDRVWVDLDIYEFDLAWVRYGQKVELTAEAYPGQGFTGTVTFVKPALDEQTRTIRVPVHVENSSHALKPGMYMSAVIKAALGRDGKAAPTGVEGKHTCSMHPQVLLEAAGACPECGMPMVRIPGESPHAEHADPGVTLEVADLYACPMKCEGDKEYAQPGNCPVCRMKLDKSTDRHPGDESERNGLLAVPTGAVLDSGTRTIVYVERGQGTFEPREVVLGPRAGGYFPVLKGLNEGERVVTRGGFLIDSQFQIMGHPSLYYPGGLLADPGHRHGGAGAASSGQSTTHDGHMPRETR